VTGSFRTVKDYGRRALAGTATASQAVGANHELGSTDGLKFPILRVDYLPEVAYS
jgi:hypothetical protein